MTTRSLGETTTGELVVETRSVSLRLMHPLNAIAPASARAVGAKTLVKCARVIAHLPMHTSSNRCTTMGPDLRPRNRAFTPVS